MPRIKLTQAAVDGLRAPKTGRVEFWDTLLPGFGIRVAATGRKTWQAFYRVDGKLIREKLGTLDAVPNVGDARALARESMTAVRRGENPVEQKRQAETEKKIKAEAEKQTLAWLIAFYLAERPRVNKKGRPLAPEYLYEIERTLTKDVAEHRLGRKQYVGVTPDDIGDLLKDVVERGSAAHANHVLSYVRTMFQWAIKRRGLNVEKDPTIGIDPPAPKVERERAFETDHELRSFWHACDQRGWPFGYLDQLLLLTLQRRDELAEAFRTEFDFDRGIWTQPGSRTKNGRPHIVHLSPLALEILSRLPTIGQQGYLFTTNGDTPVSGFGRAAENLRALTAEQGVEHFTRHDLRRSGATGMAKLKVPPHVIDKILNHSSGTISGVAGIYNRFEYLAERKKAMKTWSNHIEKLLRS